MLEFAAGAFVPAFLLAALLTPLARRIALRAGLVAPVRPDRLHREVRPYGGGLALMAVLVVFGVAALLAHPLGFYPGWPRSPLLLPLRWVAVPIGAYALESAYWHLAPLAVGAVLFFIVGLLDDRYAFSAGPKLALQVAAAAIVVFGFGLRAPVAADTAWVSQAVAVLWIVAVVNAYNLLDHADGLAAAVGVVAFVFIAMAGFVLDQRVFLTDRWLAPGVALPAAGALAGFLIYNRPPARLFMGDAGSAVVGFLLAAVPLAEVYTRRYEMSRYAVFAPLAVLAVPLFDMLCVIVSRMRRGESPFRGDATSHLAHRMLARRWSPRGIILVAAGATAATGAASLTMFFCETREIVGAWLIVSGPLLLLLYLRRPVKRRGVPHA